MPDIPVFRAPASSWPAALRAVGSALLDLIYPVRCAGCGRPGVLFCSACEARILPAPAPVCLRCGSPSRGPGVLCSACRRDPIALDGLLTTGLFAPPLRAAIHNFKYRHVCGLAQPFAARMAAVWSASGLPADVIVPVPLHASRERERGYNQAALLAQALAAPLGIPAIFDAVVRRRATASQTSLSWSERQATVRGAFTCCAEMPGRRVLVVDDVCTTGATLDACASALRDRGAGSVWGLTVARAAFQS